MSSSAQDAPFLNSRPSSAGMRFSTENPLMIGRTALGEQLLDQFRRGGWEGWRVVDNDALLHQNITAHVRPRMPQGFRLAGFTKYAESPGPGEAEGRGGRNKRPSEVGGWADLIVDVSGDPSVRWMLSSKNVARCASIFIAPTGDSVLLVEDWGRRVRLDRIEPQFYRWLIHGRRDVDCRCVSARLPPDEIARHANAPRLGLLSAVDNPDPALMVFRRKTGARYTPTYDATPHPSLVQDIRGWRIAWDQGVETNVLEMRWKEIPRETGGVILGYADMGAKSIFVVDVHPVLRPTGTRAVGCSRSAPTHASKRFGWPRETGPSKCLKKNRRTPDAGFEAGERKRTLL